jgi:rod shape-determining protein MreC
MARKQTRISRRMLLTWFMLGGLILLFAPERLTGKFQLAFARIFSLPLSVGRSISLAAGTQQPLKDARQKKESQYQNHIANLEAQLKQKNLKIQQLSGLRERQPLEGANLVLADVIRSPTNGYSSELIINRGATEGLAKGQFVIGDNSIIGIVSDVSYRAARVKLFTDTNSRIAVTVGNLDVERMMHGTGNNRAKIQLLQIKHEVHKADPVYASKRPGFLDAPMIIGKVAECQRYDKNPSLWDITVEPVCDIEKLTGVAVIVMELQDN